MPRFYREPRECPREIPTNDVFLFLKILVEYMEQIMTALSDLQAQVALNVDAEASAVVLIQGIAQQLADALAAGPGGQDPVLVDLAAKLHASADALAAAVTANTPPVVVTPPADGGSSSAEPAAS